MKTILLASTITLVALLGFTGGSINGSAPGWLSFSEAEASPYRRSVRRTTQHPPRRTTARHSYSSSDDRRHPFVR